MQETTPVQAMDSTNGDQETNPSPYLVFLGRLHQVVVHFPIALLIVAMLIEMVALVRRKQLPTTPGLVCFSIGTLSAGAAAWFGWINAVEASPSSTLDIHRWLGVSTAVLAGTMLLVAIVARLTSSRVARRVYGLGVFGCAAIVGLTGHFGGAMIYGHTYLVEMFIGEQPIALAANTSDNTDNSVAGAESSLRAIDFETHIRPILASSCLECHGSRRKRGSLRLDDASHVFSRDPDEWVIIPGNPDESELIRLIELPESDKEHMPYKKSLLSRLEIERLRLWVREGAVWGDFHPGHILNEIAQERAVEQREQEARPPTLSLEERGAILAALFEKGVLAFPVAQNADVLDVNASLLGDAFTDADLALLDGLEDLVESLNLAGTGVTDAGVASLAAHIQLRRLHLQNTRIGDDALVHVAGLDRLEYLNLYGTRVTDAGIARLAGLPNLRKIYLWKTNVTSEGADFLSMAITGLEVDRGEDEPAADEAGANEPVKTEPVETEPLKTEPVETKPVANEPDDETVSESPVPACCSSAIAAGTTCSHTCCIAAAAKGKACQICLDAK